MRGTSGPWAEGDLLVDDRGRLPENKRHSGSRPARALLGTTGPIRWQPLMPCPRCGGGLVKDLDQSDRFKCSQCSRFFRSKAAAPPDPLAPPPPPPPHPHGDGSWGQKLQRKRKRCECGQSFRPHPNGQRVQCAKCQLANQATQRREERARKGKWCCDCQTPVPTSGMSPRCDDCRLRHYREVQARAGRERLAWARASQ